MVAADSPYRYVELVPTLAAAFLPLTFPSHRPVLGHPESDGLAVGIYHEDVPIGLALARPLAIPGRAELLSLFVVPDHRHRGLGGALLTRLEALLVRKGFSMMTAVYTGGKPTTPFLTQLLARNGWLAPLRRMMVFKADLAAFGQAPFLTRGELDDSFALLRWDDLDPAEREALHNAPWVPEDLAPWHHLHETHEPDTSLALRHDGQVVGWVITHHLDHGLLRFSTGYMRPDLQRRGRLFPLYLESGKRALAKGYTRASWTVPFHHTSKAAFARRWMLPYVQSYAESFGTAKWLSPGGIQLAEDE